MIPIDIRSDLINKETLIKLFLGRDSFRGAPSFLRNITHNKIVSAYANDSFTQRSVFLCIEISQLRKCYWILGKNELRVLKKTKKVFEIF